MNRIAVILTRDKARHLQVYSRFAKTAGHCVIKTQGKIDKHECTILTCFLRHTPVCLALATTTLSCENRDMETHKCELN